MMCKRFVAPNSKLDPNMGAARNLGDRGMGGGGLLPHSSVRSFRHFWKAISRTSESDSKALAA